MDPTRTFFLGKCGCYTDCYCYADCTCSGCEEGRRHTYRGIIIGGKRYFQVQDLRPDHPLMSKMVAFPDGDAPAWQFPTMLVASQD